MSNARIDSVILYDLPPFAKQLVEFPKVSEDAELGDVHLFVGENGTGKTRLLSLLAAACGNSTELNNRLQRTAKNFACAKICVLVAAGRAASAPYCNTPLAVLISINKVFQKPS